MNGFDNLDHDRRQSAATSGNRMVSTLTRDEIDRLVARAHRMRAELLAAWGRRIVQSWASVFRRPGQLLPRDSRSPDRLAHAPQV